MSVTTTVLAAFSWLATPITAIVEGWQSRQTLSLESKTQLSEARVLNKIKLETAKVDAKIAKEMRLAETIASYDQQAQKNMATSLKDEYLILLHTLPIWGYIVPSETLRGGLDMIWLKLGEAPTYWWVVYIGMIASTFGLRWLFDKNKVNSLVDEVTKK